MHRTAQYGIAAHWRYKESPKQKEAADLAWLGQMMDWLKDLADPREFMEGLRIDLSGGRVFVFTPKGDVTNLPQGATPVDFAYTIHTEVGHRTIGAKVNGKLVPLDYELRTGDSVEILTSKAQGEGPSQDWLQFVVTPRARNKIRQWFARGRREDALDQGKELLQRQMRKQNLPFKRLATDEVLEQVVADLKYPIWTRCTSRWARGMSRRSPWSRGWHEASAVPATRTSRPRCRSRDRCGSPRPTCRRASWSKGSPMSG